MVLDTNTLVSRLLVPTSVPARAVRLAVAQDRILASEATLMELANVLARPKLDRYVTLRERQTFLRLFGRVAERVVTVHVVRACRDPRDDLDLHPFRGIPVLTPVAFLASRPLEKNC